MTIRALVFDAYGTLYDVQSVLAKAEALCSGKGEVVTQIWRLKQLEYTWLRSLLQEYEDFWAVTGASLDFALRAAAVEPNDAIRGPLMDCYLHLDPYPEVREALAGLGPQLGAGPMDRDRDQHRQCPGVQTAPILLRPSRAGARRHEGGSAVRLVKQLRCGRRQGLRFQRRLGSPQRRRSGHDVRDAAGPRGRARPPSRSYGLGIDRSSRAPLIVEAPSDNHAQIRWLATARPEPC